MVLPQKKQSKDERIAYLNDQEGLTNEQCWRSKIRISWRKREFPTLKAIIPSEDDSTEDKSVGDKKGEQLCCCCCGEDDALPIIPLEEDKTKGESAATTKI